MTRDELIAEVWADLASFEHDPEGFVLWAFPWGVPGTSLEKETGPDVWQRDQQQRIGSSLQADPFIHIREAIASGHGIGKSAEVAWTVLWALMTRENTRGTVTANTETQLRTKTWPEVTKWFRMMHPLVQELFEIEATSIHIRGDSERNWRIDAIPWSERKPEAVAGLHNAGARLLLVFDEASAIPDVIYDTAMGAQTDADTEIIWLIYGNPTRNTGRFREAVIGKERNLWVHRAIDSRTVKRTNKALLNSWVEAYGEDSDFCRIRIRGVFPRATDQQFISTELVQIARKRMPGYLASDPIIFGVDVAYFGTDKTVLAIRRGPDARTLPWLMWSGQDTMASAGYIAEAAAKWHPAAIFVDVGGIGAGVVDRLRQLMIPNVVPVNFGGAGGEVQLANGGAIRVHNMAAAMWAKVRDWLPTGSMPDNDELETDLTARTYGFDASNSIQLERKEDMRRRGLSSPDMGDALGLTFAYPVAPRPVEGYPLAVPGQSPGNPYGAGASYDYDVFKDIS